MKKHLTSKTTSNKHNQQRIKCGGNIVLRVAIATLLGGVMISQPVFADGANRQYKIPAQSLNNALMKFAADSNLELIFSADMVRSLNAKSLDGNFSPEQALGQLLKGSGYTYRFIDKHTVTLEKVPEQHTRRNLTVDKAPKHRNTINTSDSTTLPQVNVTGKTDYDIKDPYNPDYVLPNATAGTKTDTPIMETPLNVQVVSKQVMKDRQVITLADSLKNVSGVSTNSNSNSSNQGGTAQTLTLRGFSSETYFRDGFRLQQGATSRNMSNIEAVEVLKGPAAILYGMVEPGGMVNVITKQPLATPYYALNQQFGSFSDYRTTVDATGPLTQNDTLLYRLNMSYQNKNSFQDFVRTEDFFIAPVLKWNISPRTQATLEFEYNRQNLGLSNGFRPIVGGQLLDPENPDSGMVGGHILNLSRKINYGEYSPGSMETFYGGFNWSHEFNDDWKIKHRFSINQLSTDTSRLVSPLSATDTTISRIDVNESQQNKTYSTSLDLTGHFNTFGLGHTLLIGGDYYRLNLKTGHGHVLASPDSIAPLLSDIDIYHPVHTNPFPSAVPFMSDYS